MAISPFIFRRAYNALCCYASYALSLSGLVHIRHLPIFVSVEPASICQLQCPECPVGLGKGERVKRKGERIMSREVWERVLQEVSPTVHTMQFFFQGEPLLHPDLARMISDARAQNIYTIVSTNAQALTREMAEELMSVGLNRIIVSMDGLTQKSYGTYRIGGRLNQTLYALQWLRAAKQKTKARCIIELQCLKLRSNEHEWKELRSRYRAMGADRLVLKTAQLYNYEHGHPLMPSDPRHSRYEQDASGVYRLRRLHTKGCLRVWSGVVISTTGEVLPCCYDKSCAHSYGNITEQPLQQLFHNEKAQRFMRQALTYQPAICHNCWQ